jgi:hypothetical protein
MSKYIGLAVAAALASCALAACANTIVSSPTAPNEYTVSAQAPANSFAELLGSGNSEAQLAGRADALCPQGYDVLDKQQGNFESEYVRWKIRCHS